MLKKHIKDSKNILLNTIKHKIMPKTSKMNSVYLFINDTQYHGQRGI